VSEPYREQEEILRARVDDLAWQRDALRDHQLNAQRELGMVERELAETEARLRISGEPAPRRMWLLAAVPAGAVALWMAVFALQSPNFTGKKINSAQVGAKAIRQAAELYLNMDGSSSCPKLEALVAAKKLDAKKSGDPWGRRYRIACIGDEIRVTSAGKDGIYPSPDDIADNFKPSDIRRVAEL